MIKLILILISTFIGQFGLSQKYDNYWIVGYDGDDNPYRPWGTTNIFFTSGKIDTQYIPRSMSFGGACMTISDPISGNLLLYSNGCDIYNADDKVISNGYQINPGDIHEEYCEISGYPMSKNGCFLIHPGSPNKYYLLHRAYSSNSSGGVSVSKLYYSIVVREFSSWKVIEKNHLLLDIPVFPPDFNVVRHINGRDWWIMTCNYNSDQIYRFLLTSSGIKGPYVQRFIIPRVEKYTIANFIIAPNGNKAVRVDTRAGVSIMDFNRATGEYCNLINFPFWITAKDSVDRISTVGISISPNSRFLYVSISRKLWQFDLFSNDISASRILIGEYDGFKSKFGTTFNQHQIAPDNKIYINCTTVDNYLHVINQPDKLGIACEFMQHSIELPTKNQFTIPYFPNYRLGVLPSDEAETTKSYVYPNPTSNKIKLKNLHEGMNIIYNTLGQQVMNSNDTVIDVSNLISGIYFIKAMGLNCNDVIIKFLKQ